VDTPSVITWDSENAMSKYIIQHDPKRCISCGACEILCQVKNQTTREVRPGVLLTVGPCEEEETVQVRSAFRPCYHCENPWCVAVCPTQAIVKRPEDGVVVILKERCIGCRACISACPWRVPQYDATTGKAIKCDACLDRIERGLEPACVTGCATKALSFSRPNETVSRVRLKYAKSLLVKMHTHGEKPD
jgi:Fe-S-cluster-containing dehydrogenase component